MTRPETIEDIPDYRREDHTFIQVDPQFLTTDIAVGAAMLNLIAAARASEIFEVSEDGEFKVTVPLTDKEIETRVKDAQRSWDYDAERYEKACTGQEVPDYFRNSINIWAKDEGRDTIDWDEYDAFRSREEN